jgi:poly-gamma-glutamate synthesis protein (capsule biosynthesis protein)
MARELVLMAVGDIFIGAPGEHAHIAHSAPLKRERANYFDSWLERVAPVLTQADCMMGNLEGPICEGGEVDISKAGTGGAVFRMPVEVAGALKRAGVNLVSLANNQTMNLGAQGIRETMAHLKAAGIAWAGAGNDLAEAHAPAITERDGVRIATLAYTSTFSPGTAPAGEHKPGLSTVEITTAYQVPGNIRYAPGVPPKILTTPNARDVERMVEDVKRAKQSADIVVVNWHWGLTRYANAYAMGIELDTAPFYVLDYQEDMGRAAVDAGADLVVGHHPHRLQGMQIYQGKLICYSLCNLVMSFDEGVNFGPESVILKGVIDPRAKRIGRLSLIPIYLPSNTMEPSPVPEQAEDYAALMTRISRKYGTRFHAVAGEVAIELA